MARQVDVTKTGPMLSQAINRTSDARRIDVVTTDAMKRDVNGDATMKDAGND